jgi:hypothetical protein
MSATVATTVSKLPCSVMPRPQPGGSFSPKLPFFRGKLEHLEMARVTREQAEAEGDRIATGRLRQRVDHDSTACAVWVWLRVADLGA